MVVQDISAESNYLACSPQVRAELAIPILDGRRVLGVLDVDSHTLAPFGSGDRHFLEGIADTLAALLWEPQRGAR